MMMGWTLINKIKSACELRFDLVLGGALCICQVSAASQSCGFLGGQQAATATYSYGHSIIII